MFTRQEVCDLADIKPERFKTLIRRDQLPAVLSQVAEDEDANLHRFSAEATVLIAIQENLSRQIGYADGLSSKTAAQIVSQHRAVIRDVLMAPASTRSRERWLGYAGGTPIKLGDPPGGRDVSGTLKEVVKVLERDEYDHARLFLANVDAVLREVDARARKHLKIDFGASARIELMEEQEGA